MRVLFVAASLPYPPLRGYQVRAAQQLRFLSRHHRVTLVCYADADVSSSARKRAADCCEEIVTVPYRLAGAARALSIGLTTGLPVQTSFYETRAMSNAIDRLLAEKRHDLVHALTVRVAGLLDGVKSVPRVIDFVDAISLNLRRRAEYDRTPLKFAARLEANRLARYEREICRTWDHATVVSQVDRAAIGDFPNLSVNTSGVDVDQFAYTRENREPHTILFSGNLGYFPNVDAISWFARHVFPAILREEPNARLRVVGARPGLRVRALAKLDPRIAVIGEVGSLSPYLQGCCLAIAPMRAGSGQLFKILEAMASGAPMVATGLAAAATGAESGRHLLIADNADSFARSVLRLIREPDLAERIAAEARQLIEQRFRWEDSIAGLEQIYQSATRARHRGEIQAAAV